MKNKIIELKNKLSNRKYFKIKLGKKHKGNGFLEYVLIICIGAAIYLIATGKAEALINSLWEWASRTISTIIK